MGLSLSARGQSSAVPAALTPARSRPFDLSFTIKNNGSSHTGAICYGTTDGTEPGTFADLNNGASINLQDVGGFNTDNDTLTVRRERGGGTYQQAGSISGLDLSTMTEGEHLWIAATEINDPVSGTHLWSPLHLGVVGA